MNLVKNLFSISLSFLFISGAFADVELDKCLQREVLNPGDAETIAQLKTRCLRLIIQKTDDIVKNKEKKQESPGDPFLPFQSYKDNYLVWGPVRLKEDEDGPFGKETNDLKIRFGFSQSPFRKVPEFVFAYSQKSFWDINGTSKPFWDHNFNPEFFYTIKNPYAQKSSSKNYFARTMNFLRFGVEHESNGVKGVNSREWNRGYLKSEFSLSDDLKLDVKLWNVAKDDGNKAVTKEDGSITKTKMEDFLGNFEIGIRQKFTDHISWQVAVTKGRETNRYNFQTDFILSFRHFNPEIFLTVYDGYGESLLTYDQKTFSARIGIRFRQNCKQFGEPACSR